MSTTNVMNRVRNLKSYASSMELAYHSQALRGLVDLVEELARDVKHLEDELARVKNDIR